MLCCWLQQLQEFGGPEVDKPDLLQGSGGCNTRTPLRGGSSPSLAKQLIVDPRVRYNVSSYFEFQCSVAVCFISRLPRIGRSCTDEAGAVRERRRRATRENRRITGPPARSPTREPQSVDRMFGGTAAGGAGLRMVRQGIPARRPATRRHQIRLVFSVELIDGSSSGK